VQATSELEARGIAVYTLALFRCLETESTVPPNMFEQGFVTACMRAVASDKPVVYAPSAVCLHHPTDARQHVPAVASYDFKHLTQTINQLARRYTTMIKTSFTTHLPKRQVKTVRMQVMEAHPRLSRSLCSFCDERSRVADQWYTSQVPEHTDCRSHDPVFQLCPTARPRTTCHQNAEQGFCEWVW
jgi:hypothetical protein